MYSRIDLVVSVRYASVSPPCSVLHWSPPLPPPPLYTHRLLVAAAAAAGGGIIDTAAGDWARANSGWATALQASRRTGSVSLLVAWPCLEAGG
eukprot:COSAG02_NODE_3807_length_6202_cov_12.468458_4_plen_93_part_00